MKSDIIIILLWNTGFHKLAAVHPSFLPLVFSFGTLFMFLS